MQFTPTFLHISLSILSGLLLLLIGLVNVSRAPSNKLNQIYFGFYGGIGIYQFFDGIQVYIVSTEELVIVNLMRDISITGLIVGLAFGALGTLIIEFGEDFIFRIQIIGSYFGVLGLILLMGIFGDSIIFIETGFSPYGLPLSTSSHSTTTRDLAGWLGITGSFVLFSGIIIISIFFLSMQADPFLRKKLLQILGGFFLTVILLFLFDISFNVEYVSANYLGNDIIHFFAHAGIITGILIILFAYWKPSPKIYQNLDNLH